MDVTEQKLQEQLLRMIAEIDYDIITEIDINKNQYKLLSFNKEDGNTLPPSGKFQEEIRNIADKFMDEKSTNEYLTKIRQFKQQCAEKYGIISIGIFGSVARGEQHEGSDLDVFVELKEPDPFVMFDIKEELEHICNCKIDLLRLRKNLRSLISQRIEKDGIYA